ncbi:MAG: PQQ-binding-like beta-propeller repeat protein [Hamadaea sp.]|nr:PQQ-binding-like beta-propeller repeat protein [Hamadaea sp.]
MTLIDLGEREHVEWQPPARGMGRSLRPWRSHIVAAAVGLTVLIGLPASAPAASPHTAVPLTALAEAEGIDVLIAGAAVTVLHDEVIAVDLATGEILWERPGTAVAVAERTAAVLTVHEPGPVTALVDARTGATLAQAEGSPLGPAIDGVQAVVDRNRREIAGLGSASGWRHPWDARSTALPVYADGVLVAQKLLVAPSGALAVLDLRTGDLREVAAPPAGEAAIGLVDGAVRTVSAQQRAMSPMTITRISEDGLVRVESEHVIVRAADELFVCGVYTCASDGDGIVAYASADGRLAWAAGRFAVERPLPGMDGLLLGRLADPLRPEQTALLDVRTGKVVAKLGRWLVAVPGHTAQGSPSPAGGRDALVAYLPGKKGQAWLGVLDRGGATVRPSVHLTDPVEACGADGDWVVCRSGIAGAPPFAVHLSPSTSPR